MSEEEKGFRVVDKRIDFEESEKTSEQEKQAEGAQEPQAEAKPEQGPTEEQRAKAAREMPLPKVDFPTFIISLSSSALMHLGEVPGPDGGEANPDLPLAKHTIDILAMLEEKTKNNLSEYEARLLRDVLFELRMKYVQKAK